MQEEENRVPERDDSTAAFLRHKGSIFSVALSPTNDNLACSGGEDDLAWLWKVDSGEDLFQLQGHTDSVIDVAFNCDGKYVATAGMDGVVMIWNAEDGKEVVSLTGPSEITVGWQSCFSNPNT
jgi:ribosome assembly protein SQT1